MAALDEEVKLIIEQRDLSHWHLLIASLLGSLASHQKMFNQAFLNMLLKHSMEQFIIPYFEGLENYHKAMDNIPQNGSLQERLLPVVTFINEIFGLASQVTVTEGDNGNSVVSIVSSGCRFCPVGVGKATLTPGMTFCPFPTMIEETASAMLKTSQIKMIRHREGLKTNILTKCNGNCSISYTEEN